MSNASGNIGRIAKMASTDALKALEWIEAIRRNDTFGFSPNELKLMALADEIYRLRQLLMAKR
jgi:hypothetical protein